MARAHLKSKATCQHRVQPLASHDAPGAVPQHVAVQGPVEANTAKKKHKKKHKEKKKSLVTLPSATSLLANVPASLLGRAENVIDSEDEEDPVVDMPGTKYNQVAPPVGLGAVNEEEAFRLKPSMSLELQKQAQNKQLAKINKHYDKQQQRAQSSAPPELPMATTSSLQFAPRQIKGKANVSTEDLEGMGLKKHKATT